MSLEALDLSPIEGELTGDDQELLERVAALDPTVYRIGVEDERIEDELPAIVERGRDGRWWAGRYIGSITIDGRTLLIRPRLGIGVIEAWLDQAFGLVAPPTTARHAESEAFMVRLLARLWCRSLDTATRHGLPLLRLPQPHEGLFVRGRLDVHRTIALVGQGRETIASTTYDRSLTHPITRAIVCAERALADRLASGAEWRTERVKQVLPPMRASVGSRPRLPAIIELRRVRYTPITLQFKRAALLSHRIASHLGYSVTDEEGAAEGLLVDVAELWELFVLNCTRQAAPALRIEHGSAGRRRDYLLRSADESRGIGRLKPDVLVFDRDLPLAVIDAKYKRVHDSRERPAGVDQADLYQLVAYATRFKPSAISALAYPEAEVDQSRSSTAVDLSPWRDDEHAYAFITLPVTASECRQSLEALLADAGAA
jgi:5-methylcytosine-specific restriction enzyme subunit McrC